MTEFEKMAAGELYDTLSAEILNGLGYIQGLCEKYNRIPRKNEKKRRKILEKVLAGHGERFTFEAPIMFDFGHVTVGEDFYCNHDCVFLDSGKITFGHHTFIGPQCGFYTVNHPIDAGTRNKYVESAKPITVGDSVWFGGGVRVLPGVTIGDNVVIGAGSVVVHDIPSNSVAVGNPARVVKTIPPERK